MNYLKLSSFVAINGFPVTKIGPFDSIAAVHDWYRRHGHKLEAAGVEESTIDVLVSPDEVAAGL